MKSKGIALLAVAIVAIGIFALPSSVSLFSGQHTWYDLSGDGNDVPCEKCHAEIKDEMISIDNGVHETVKCEGAPRAGGFGLTEDAADTGEKAAHLPFVDDSIDDPLMKGANEACISCHTRIGVEITWTKNENLEFDATEDGYGIWAISAFAAGGSNVTYVNTNNTWTNQ
jgi:hypothetical protein